MSMEILVVCEFYECVSLQCTTFKGAQCREDSTCSTCNFSAPLPGARCKSIESVQNEGRSSISMSTAVTFSDVHSPAPLNRRSSREPHCLSPSSLPAVHGVCSRSNECELRSFQQSTRAGNWECWNLKRSLPLRASPLHHGRDGRSFGPAHYSTLSSGGAFRGCMFPSWEPVGTSSRVCR